MSKLDKIRQKLTGSKPNYKRNYFYLYYKKIIDLVKPDVIHVHHAHQRPIVAWLSGEKKITTDRFSCSGSQVVLMMIGLVANNGATAIELLK